MGRRVLEVELAGVASVVRGYGSRDLVTTVTGRPPTWRPARHGWSVQESTAADVVAAAERLNYDIVITGPRAVALEHGAVGRPDQGADQGADRGDDRGDDQPDPGAGLW
jgi:hypothetical protein